MSHPFAAALDVACARLKAALALADAALRLRAEIDDDRDALVALYTEFRWDELAPAPWPDEAKQAFLADQFTQQANHYRAHYQGARYLVVADADNQAIGRLYLYRSKAEYRLMDIMLFERCRGRGVGRALIDALLATALEQAVDVSLHVERDNPARDFYLRRGFVLDEDRGVYHFMRWTSGGSPAGQRDRAEAGQPVG